MMKKWLVIPALLLLSSCYSQEQASNYPHALTKNEIIDTVKIGDKIVVEQKVLSYQGQDKIVEGQIILPDGTLKSGNSFFIEMPGKYIVSYRAFFGTHEESLSITYHCHRTSGDFFLSSTNNKPDTGEYSHPLITTPIKGAKLSLDSKTTFTYDGEIDFNSFSSSDSFIDFAIDTSEQATSDIESFTVRLTDVEDANNYVDITVTDSGPVNDDGRGCYMLAGSNKQFKTGFEGNTKHISTYGTNVNMSFRNLPEKNERVAKLYFDYPSKKLYVSPIIDRLTREMITDLDDKGIYGSSVWEGFKSGKAKISVFANSLLSNSATLIVTKIAEHDLTPLDFVDTVSPNVIIDFNGQSSISVPKASVNKPYRIFDASVTDNYNHHLSYSTYVTYYDALKNKTKDITVTDGYFTPKQAGEYTITYVTQDYSHNEATKELIVYAVNDSQQMTITLDEDTINENLYSPVALPSLEDVKSRMITGGSGRPSLTRHIYDGNSQEIIIEGDTFIPTKIGQYKVFYIAQDYINNLTSAILTVNVLDPGKPVFIEDFHFPRLLIKGHRYTLTKYMGAEVVNGETTYLESKLYVNNVYKEDSSFVAEDTCNIVYKLEGSTGNTEYATSVEVIDVGNPIALGSYFYGDFSTQVNRTDVTLSASSGNASSLFASVLPYESIYVGFAFNNDTFNCNELVFKFTDSNDENNSLSFHIRVRDEKTYISFGNDPSEYEFTSFKDGDINTYAIDFSISSRMVKDVLHNNVEIIRYNDIGEEFTGFSGGLYLDIYMNNITGPSSFKMLKISNQALGNLGLSKYRDIIVPVIVFKQEVISEQDYQADAYIPAADVYDVISDASVTVTVTAPDKSEILTNADARVDHTFKLEQFGNYTVIYEGVDGAGNKASFQRDITVYDQVAPELTITGHLASSYSIRSAIKIPSYTVSDNHNDYTLNIFLMLPNNEERLLLVDVNGDITSYLSKDNLYYNASFKVNDTTFVAEQYGHYVLRYVAYDSDFNKTVKELHFTVK